jgi:AAA+ superfamily predicted ATPase
MQVHASFSGSWRAILQVGCACAPLHTIAAETQLSNTIAGANFFNLSPRNTDGKYPKKAAAMMLHIVFKVAKAMAPSVIFIDEAEKVFLSDKKKLKEFASAEPYNRIKKDLIKARRPQGSVHLIRTRGPARGVQCTLN